MTKYIKINTTFNNLEEANKVIDILLNNRLVACAQINTITSKYHWKGNIETAKEYLLTIKTKKELYKEIEKTILENHSYETPQIIATDIIEGYSGYLNWIEEETK